jgi:hypothetical protein
MHWENLLDALRNRFGGGALVSAMVAGSRVYVTRPERTNFTFDGEFLSETGPLIQPRAPRAPKPGTKFERLVGAGRVPERAPSLSGLRSPLASSISRFTFSRDADPEIVAAFARADRREAR